MAEPAIIGFTKDELDLLEELAADIINPISDALAVTLAAELTESLAVSIEAGLEGVTRAEALDIAGRQTAAMVGDVIKTTRAGLAQTIASGLEAGKGPIEIARSLRDQIGLDAARVGRLEKLAVSLEGEGFSAGEIEAIMEVERDKAIASRAETIARTETRDNIEGAEFEVASTRGMTHKASISVGDDKVSEICQACQDESPIPIDQAHASGDMHPTHHPNCRCSEIYFRGEAPEL